MGTKHKVLIVRSSQFGYHTDTLMYCKYIDKSVFDIHYIGFDMGYDRFNISGVYVHYIPCHKNKLIRNLLYLTALYKINRGNHFDLVFHVHEKFSFIIRMIFLTNNYILDIRTGNLHDNKWIRQIGNDTITVLSKLSNDISVISLGLADMLQINQKKLHIIPLGGESPHLAPKDFSTLCLLYVGTLSKRNIQDTVIGLALFNKTYNDVDIVYDIVGSGYPPDVDKVKECINNYGLNKLVHLHGFVKFSELTPFFNKSNIGVVYIPQEEYYQYQPSTKLYEYLLAGMPVIATNTYENKIEVNDMCGVICEDNPVSFSSALEKIYLHRRSFDSDVIKKQKINSSWELIVKEKVEPYFKKVISKGK